jgi:hypothetical protein
MESLLIMAKMRKAQHELCPVSKKVLAWEEQKGDEITFEVLEKFICSSKKQLVAREYEYIARHPKELCMNTNGLIKTAEEKTVTKVEPLVADYSRFAITDDVKNCRFRIQWRNEKGEKKDKEISYKVKPKADQLARTELFRAELIKLYYI